MIESGQKVYIGEDLPGEYTQSKYTQKVLEINPNIVKAKNKASANIKEIIEIATNRRWKKTEHTDNKDAKYGMYRYGTRFGFPVKNQKGNVVSANIYKAELVIRNASDGRKYLYDIVNIKKDTVSSDWMSKKISSAADFSAGQKNNVSKDSILNPDENVNTKFSDRDSSYLEAVEKGDMETAQRMVDEAAEEAGYSTTKLYHGTGTFGFTKFDLSKSDDKRTIFLTNNERIASTYSGVSSVRKISDVYNKDVNKLSAEDISKELNYFVKEYYKDTFESADYNYSYYNLEKLNNLINVVNDGLVELTSDVEQKISEYADKIARSSDDSTAKTYRQLVSLKEKLDKWDYNNLSTPIYLLIHHTDALADNSAKYADLEANIRLMNSLRTHQDITEGVVVEESHGRYSIEIMGKAEAVSKLNSLSQKGNYALYAKMKNPLIIDGKGKNWNEIHNWTGALVPSIDELKLAKEGDHYQLIDAKTGADIQGAVVPITPAIEKESKEQVISFLRSEALHRFAIKYEGKKTTREIAKIAKENGYDSVLIKNITDNGGQNFNVGMEETADIYILFDSNNAKSADPVTYDDNGNVIPLSERFNESNSDIRYSDRDYSYETLVNKPDMKLAIVGGNIPANRADIIHQAKKNAEKIGKVNSEDKTVSVFVEDIGRDVVIGTDGLRHGLSRGKNIQDKPIGIVTLKAGEIIKNSIRINELTPSKESAKGSYVLIGASVDHDGNLYLVRSVVNEYGNNLASMDVLYAINTKKESAMLNASRYAKKSLSVTDPTISIAELLKYVNKYFPAVLPETVLRHYGYDARPDGDLGESVLFSDREETSVYELMGERERLLKENKNFKTEIERLKERLKLERQVTHGNHFNENQLSTVAGHLRNISNSNMDKAKLMKTLKDVYSFIAHSPELTWAEVFEKCYKIADDMLAEAKPEKMVDDYSKQILKEIRNKRMQMGTCLFLHVI